MGNALLRHLLHDDKTKKSKPEALACTKGSRRLCPSPRRNAAESSARGAEQRRWLAAFGMGKRRRKDKT